MAKAAGLLGLLVVVTGLVPLSTAGGVLVRLAPVMLFLVAVTVLAELAGEVYSIEMVPELAARARRTLAAQPDGGVTIVSVGTENIRISVLANGRQPT